MQLTPVKSSNILSVGFEEGKQLTLSSKPTNTMRVHFHNGTMYDYYGVPKETYEELLSASSVGSYFHKNIIGKYPFELFKDKD